MNNFKQKGDLIMKIMDGIRGKRGVTLNIQLVELLSILDEPISDAEKDAKIQRYIDSLRTIDSRFREAKEKGPMARFDFAIGIRSFDNSKCK